MIQFGLDNGNKLIDFFLNYFFFVARSFQKKREKSIRKVLLTLKSRISANMYGPPCVNVRVGFIISDRITESAPYLPRNNFAHSIPSWPKPPKNQHGRVNTHTNTTFSFHLFPKWMDALNTCPLLKSLDSRCTEHNWKWNWSDLVSMTQLDCIQILNYLTIWKIFATFCFFVYHKSLNLD